MKKNAMIMMTVEMDRVGKGIMGKEGRLALQQSFDPKLAQDLPVINNKLYDLESLRNSNILSLLKLLNSI